MVFLIDRIVLQVDEFVLLACDVFLVGAKYSTIAKRALGLPRTCRCARGSEMSQLRKSVSQI